MGRSALDKAIHKLSEAIKAGHRPTLEDVGHWRALAGGKVNGDEREAIAEFMGHHLAALSPEVRARISEDFDPGGTPAGLTVVRRCALEVLEASALVSLGAGGFLVVDDEQGIIWQPTYRGSRTLVSSREAALEGLEGMCLDDTGELVYVIGEKRRVVVRFRLVWSEGGPQLIERTHVGLLPDIAESKKAGWEGLAWLPAALGDGRAHLVAVHERKPRLLGLFPLEDLSRCIQIELPEMADEALKDLSDVAVEPGTGRLWVLSHESASIAVLSRVPGASVEGPYRCDGLLAVPPEVSEQPEGICFDDEGRVWLVGEAADLVVGCTYTL